MARVTLTQAQKTDALAKDVTKRCKELAKTRGLTHLDIATVAGVSQQEVTYELNHTISTKVMIALAMLTDSEVFHEKRINRISDSVWGIDNDCEQSNGRTTR